MTDTDVDTQSETDLAEQETEAKLPWESIDPDEQPVAFTSPFASTGITPVEAGKGRPAPSPLTTPILLDRFSLLESEAATALSEEEREAQLADRAFFSDEKISIEMLHPQPAMEEVSDSSVLLAHADETPEFDPFSDSAHAVSMETEHYEVDNEERTPQAGRLTEDLQEDGDLVEIARDTDLQTIASATEEVEQGRQLNAELSTEAIQISETGIAPRVSAPAEQLEEIIAQVEATESTPWETMDEIPVVYAVSEPTIAYTNTESLLTAASELSALSESIVAEEIEHPGDQTILVSVSPEEAFTGFANGSLQAAVQQTAATEVEVDLEPELDAPVPTTGGMWTIPLMCLGIGLIACCMVIPQGESNRRLRYEQASLAANYQQVQKQVAVNNEFLTKVMDDPTLAERLAGRQMKTIRKGQKIIDMQPASDDGDMSPFSLVAIAKPADLPPYKPKTGTVANLCNNARSRLYLLGTAMAMVAVGLVMGFGSPAKVEK